VASKIRIPHINEGGGSEHGTKGLTDKQKNEKAIKDAIFGSEEDVGLVRD